MGKKIVKDDSIPGVVIEPPIEEYCNKPTFDEDGVQVTSGIGKDGKEYPDPVPLAPPVDYVPPPDLMQMIRTMIHSERLKQEAEAAGWETFDEADDFDVEDDPLDPLTDYERVFMPPAEPSPVADGGKRAPQEAATPPAPSAAGTPNTPGSPEAPVASPAPGTPPTSQTNIT